MREVSVENDRFPSSVLSYEKYDTNNITGNALELKDFIGVKQLNNFDEQFNNFKNNSVYFKVNNINKLIE